MRALKPAQPVEPTEATDMPSQPDQVAPMDALQNTNVDDEPPLPPVAPETGPSPDQDMSDVAPILDPPPGNWEISPDDVYTQRQQVQGPSVMNPAPHVSPILVPNMMSSDDSVATVPGAAPKARGPLLSVAEAKQPAVTITVPLPLRQRMNPHMPPPRINVPIPKMPYAFHPRSAGVPFPMTHAARIPYVSEVPQGSQSQSALPPRRQIRTIRVPLRGPPPTPLCLNAKERKISDLGDHPSTYLHRCQE